MRALWLLCLLVVWICPRPSWGQHPSGARGFEQFNKLAVRNYLPCGGFNVVTGWANFTDPQCQQLSTTWLTDSTSIALTTNPLTLENKFVVPRKVILTISGNTVTPTIDTGDLFFVNAIPATLTIANPIGTGGNPRDGQEFGLCLASTAPRVLIFGSQYEDTPRMPLPATTTGDGGPPDCFKFMWIAADTEWLLLASNVNTAVTTGILNLPVTSVKLHTQFPVGPSVAGENSIIWFDPNSPECVIWETTLPPDYVGSPVARFWYVMQLDTNTTHTATLDVSVMALKGGVTIHTNSFAPANNCDDTAIPGAVGVHNEITCPLTNNDAMVANDPIKLQVCTDVTTGTWTDDLGVFRARLEYAR